MTSNADEPVFEDLPEWEVVVRTVEVAAYRVGAWTAEEAEQEFSDAGGDFPVITSKVVEDEVLDVLPHGGS
jgi:hypothetical protein